VGWAREATGVGCIDFESEALAASLSSDTRLRHAASSLARSMAQITGTPRAYQAEMKDS
jgi:hypothetical protein